MQLLKPIFLLLFIFLLSSSYSSINAAEITAFGPEQYVRTNGAPNIYTETFTAEPGEALLVIRNGKPGQKSNEDNRVTSGEISLNGAILFSHDDFKHQTYTLETPITLLDNNSFRIELESKPDTYISLEIIQTIPDPVYDLWASDLQVDSGNCPEYIDLSLQITNTGEDAIPAGVQVAFYNGNPDEDGVFIGTYTSTTELPVSNSEDITFQWLNPSVEEATLYARVDDDGSGTGAYEEVDETNNLISIEALLCQAIPLGDSSVSGRVIDAVNGTMLSGVQMSLHIDDNGTPGAIAASLETDSEGAFLFSGLAAGSYIITSVHDGYIDNQRSITVGESVQLTNQDLVLSPVLDTNEIRIVLTWGSKPADLEAHLTAPNETGCRYHCYYFNKTIPTASLDLDDRNGYGPETITITDKFSGTYRYYVHDFTNRYANSRWLALSGAEVKVYSGNREPMVFTVPDNYGNDWHVFDLDGETGEIIPVQTISRQSEPGRIDYPTISSSSPFHAYWNTLYTYQVLATDPDNDPLTYSLQQAPEGMTIDPITGLIEWTPIGNQSGYYTIVVKVEDDRCGEVTKSFVVYAHTQPTVKFTVSPCSGYNPGGDITFTWETTLASTVLIDQGIGEVPANGSLTIPSPDVPTVYTLTAFNDVTLTKRTVPTAPHASFYFSPRYIYAGQSTTLYWNPKCATNAVIDHNVGEVTSAGSMKLTPTEKTTYKLSLTNAYKSVDYYATVSIVVPPPVFTISPVCNLTPGEPLTLRWEIYNATNVSISPDIGEVEPFGSRVVYPTDAGSYTLTATVDGKIISRTVNFPNLPQVNVSPYYPYGIDLGDSVILSWSSKCADTITMNQGVGEIETIGSLTVTPESLPQTYTVTATNERGPSSRSVKLYQIPPRGTLTADPAVLKVGNSTTLTWSTTRADTCTISPDIGPVNCNGSMTVTPTSPTYYYLTMVNNGGTRTSWANVGFVAPVADLKASSLTINQGETVKLTWIYANATSCVIDQGIGEVGLGGERTVAPISTTTYTMTATGPGGTKSDSITINVVPSDQPPIINMSASPEIIMRGNSTVLSWESSYTDSLTIEPGIGSVENTGSLPVSPEETTTYTATATGPGGTIIKRVMVTVIQQAPAMTLSVDPASIMEGESAVLSWTSSNVETIILDQGIGEVPLQGSLTVSPDATTLYTAIAIGPGGTLTKHIALNVNHPAPTVNFSASPLSIQQGESTTLSWSTENAETVTIMPNIGEVGTSGTRTVSPAEDTTYIISAVGVAKTVTSSIEVEVYPELQLQVDSPADGSTLTKSNISVSGQISVGASVTVNGITATIDGTSFSAELVLDTPGQHTIYVRATDSHGQEKAVEISVNYIPELIIEVNEPTANSIVYSTPIQVSGQVTNNAAVTVNGVAATVSDNTFTVSLPLATEGLHTFLVEAHDSFGQQKSITVNFSYFNIPAVTIGSDKYRITSGESVTLTWTSENCESAELEPGIGPVSCSESKTITPTQTTEFIIRATGLGKTVRASALIVVDDPYGEPTPEEQVHLEAINRARANPPAEAARLNIDLNEGPPSEIISPDPVPPLSFNTLLARAARGHSRDMIDNHYLAHEGSDGSLPAERCEAEGYEGGIGENISLRLAAEPLDSFEISQRMHDDLFVDSYSPGRDHRINILFGSYKEVGVGLYMESIYPEFAYGGIVTCNFGVPENGTGSMLGVVYEDTDENSAYDGGEGVANVLVEDLESNDKVYTASAGGYSLPLTNGEHTIRVTLPDGRSLKRQVTMAGENIKLDFRVDMFSEPIQPVVNLHAVDQVISPGETTRLTWESNDAEYAEMDNGIGYVPVNGSINISPAETTTYTITVTGQGESITSSVTVYVNDFSISPSVDFTVYPATINQGESATLVWSTENAADAYIDDGIGEVIINGSITVTPDHSTTYTISVANQSGVVNKKVRVTVIGNPELQPAGSFGAIYNNLIPIDATIDSYNSKRFSLITGKIMNISGTPLAGVSVMVLDHPEYGTAYTDDSGSYTIPVQGGVTLTVQYDLTDYLPVQRQVYVPVNDIGIAETVQLLQEDPLATQIIFDGNPDNVIVHRSSVISDSSGTRSVTMVFQGDNRAYVVDENGNDIQGITSFTTRATEYQTPESMPAELPKTSAFTYCTEMSVDGVDRVRFEHPVVTWVDNFLGFEIGTVVPAGYYDRDKGIWVASKNGIVVELLDTDSDGTVDSVDSNGDGLADDLNNNGDVYDEALGLSDPFAYSPGTTFWRVEVTHFTPWDYNYCSYYSLLQMLGIGSSFTEPPCPDCPKTSSASSVSDQSLAFEEYITIPGTGLSLVYASDRTAGFDNVITVPASGTSVPDSVKRIIVEVEIAGQKLTKTLPALPEQVAEFVWDGRDSLGNPVFHKVTAHVRIGFVYDSVYMQSGYLEMSFAEFGTSLTSVPTREEVISWQRSALTINIADKASGLAQGWTLSAHHKLTPTDPTTLHRGNGSTVKNITSVMTTAAGNGQDGWPIDSVNALDTPVGHPASVAMDAAGNLYVANQVYSAILKIDKTGLVEVVAGGETGVNEEDNIDAKDAKLRIPNDIAFDSRGNLYIADAGAFKIRKIGKDGIITTVAGNGVEESSGDNGPAVEAGIMPTGMTVDDFGNIYIAEGTSCVGGTVDPVTGQCIDGNIVESSYRIRKVSTNGIISTIVGTGEKYDPDIHESNGDGGPASEAYLSNPTSVSVDRYGNLYIADDVRIRKVNASGIITTVAGNGISGYTGDGGLATDAQITHASGITFDKKGNFYFSQYLGNGDVIRKVTDNGYISTVAGAGEPGLDGDNGPATHALLKQPQRLVIDAFGFIYIPDQGNGLVRKVSIDSYNEGEVHFVEANVGHLFSADGYQKKTYDLETGLSLLTFAYNTNKQLSSITDQFGNVVNIEYDGLGFPEAIISPDGLRTELTIDEYNQLTAITYPDNSSYGFEYQNNDGLLTAKNEPNGNRYEHHFDENGRITYTSDGEGGLWQFSRTKSYDGTVISSIVTPNTSKTVEKIEKPDGSVKKRIVAPTGETITSGTAGDGLDMDSQSTCGPAVKVFSDLDRWYGYTYSHSARLTTPAGLEMTTGVERAYTDDNGDNFPERVTTQMKVNNRVSTLVHDVVNATHSITSPENRTVTMTYDPNTLQTVRSSVSGMNDTLYSYLDNGKLSSVSTGSRSVQYTYDMKGNLASITDPRNLTTYFTDYDEVGRLTRAVRQDNTVMQYGYDENGNMTLLTTPLSADNTFTYNTVNKQTAYQTHLGSTTRYSYNAERQLTRVTLPSTKEIINTYSNGRLTETATDEWVNSYSYLCGNQLDSVTRGSESISYGYDGDLLTRITQSGTLNTELGLTYNNDFDLTTFSYANGTESYEYDQDGLLTRSGAYNITRNIDNGLPETVSDSIFSLSRSFNGYGEVDAVNLNVSSSPIMGSQYTRNDNGQIVTKVETINGVQSIIEYSYDDLGRLLKVMRDGNLKEEYRYDNNGNRIYELNNDLGISGRSLAYSIEDHIISAGDITFEFDYDDNLAARIDADGTTEYQYSSTGELMSIALPDGKSVTYINDPNGKRIAKLVNGVIVEKYLWSGLTTLLAVYDGSDTLVQRFEYADGRMPLAMTMGGVMYYLAYDQVGTLRLVSDSSGNIVKQIDYDTFGNIINDTNPAFSVPFGFAGGLHDLDTGLVRFGYRDYMPEIGKWTAKDPILFAGGDSNLYGYVENDPVNWVDPWGLARVGGRPLDSNNIPFNGRGPLHHSQIWYDDGTNSGFFDDDSIRPDNGHDIDEYDFSRDPRHYEDWMMRDAERNVQRNWDMDWRMPPFQKWNNCQDYTEAVRDEHDRIRDDYKKRMGYPSGDVR